MMKRWSLLVAVFCVGCGSVRAVADGADAVAVSRAAAKFYMTIETGTPGQADYRFIYTDRAGHVHIYAMKDGALNLAWEATTLGSRATSMFVTDLYADGKLKLVVSTVAGRVLIYDLATYQQEWENLQQRYTRIDYMEHANLDNDRQQEVVILADDRVSIFDGYNRNVQWSSTTPMVAKFMVIGNVDDDPQLEIILNTGRIIDSRFYNIQFETDQPFGDRLMLADVTGDGYADVIGEFPDRTVRVFDVWRGREVW
jgi:hypothetical protein